MSGYLTLLMYFGALMVAVNAKKWTKGELPDMDADTEAEMLHDHPVEHDELWCRPEQLHLSFGNTTSDMVVLWSTRGACDALIQYAAHPWKFDLEAKGKSVKLTGDGQNTVEYMHRVVLKGLSPSTTYYYRPVVKSGVGASRFYFMTPPLGSDWSPSFLVASSLGPQLDLINEAQSGDYSSMLYNGPLQTEGVSLAGTSDTKFLNDMEQMAATLPLFTSPGIKSEKTKDGQEDDLEVHSGHRFSFPGSDWPSSDGRLWYSIDIGPVHLISYSTHILFAKDTSKASAQQAWLVQDLTEVNKKRKQTPWVIAVGNHPMYCAYGSQATDDCARNTSKIRHGLEDIFYHFAVDLVLESHLHMYERSWPQYKGVLVAQPSYLQPRAPVEIILGSEEHSETEVTSNVSATAEWSAFHLSGVGKTSYGCLTVFNASHLHWQLKSSKSDTVLDDIWLQQDNHGNFSVVSLPHNISHQINKNIIALGGKPGTFDFTSDPANAEGGVDWSEYSLWIGLGTLVAVLVLVVGVVTLRSCVKRRRARASKRWRDVNKARSGGNFHSLGSESESDDNDFEIDVFDKAGKQSSKLLTSY